MGSTNIYNQGFAFEKVVKSIFSVLAAKEKRPIQYETTLEGTDNCNMEADIYLEKGLFTLGIETKACIEIKNKADNFRLVNWYQKTESCFPNVLLIFVVNTDDSKAKEMENKLRKKNEFRNFRVLGNGLVYQYGDLVKTEYFFYLQNQESISSFEYKNGIRTISAETNQNISEKLSFSESDFLAYQGEIEKKIRKCITSEPVALILGNGISMSAGSRSWDCLSKELNYLLGEYLSYPSIDKKILGTSSYSDTLLSHYCCTKNAKGERYYKTIYRCLYESTKIPASIGSLMDGTAQFVIHHKPLILTFNFDSLFEEELQKGFGVAPTTFWKNRKVLNTRAGISIFHIHGYYPRNMPSLDSDHRMSLVLDEEEYYKFYCESGDTRRVKLEKTLNSQTCFLVGLSISDSFLRNCIRQSGKKAHYAFMCGEHLPSFPDLATLSAIFYNMNIEVLWKNSYSEIASFLTTL